MEALRLAAHFGFVHEIQRPPQVLSELDTASAGWRRSQHRAWPIPRPVAGDTSELPLRRPPARGLAGRHGHYSMSGSGDRTRILWGLLVVAEC